MAGGFLGRSSSLVVNLGCRDVSVAQECLDVRILMPFKKQSVGFHPGKAVETYSGSLRRRETDSSGC